MRCFVTGSKGQLGRDCLDVFADGTEVSGLDLPDLDITDPSSVHRVLSKIQPDVIINCAGYTQVDRAETERAEAWRANVDGPRVLAEQVEEHGGLLVHISTDYVFGGRKPAPQAYVETDPTGPLSWYGETKLEGEQIVQKTTDRHLILRSAWLYGATGRFFLRKILQAALARPEIPLRVVNDQFGCPTWTRRLALQMRKALEAGARGLYHAVAEGGCTWYELAAEFLRLMGVKHEVQPRPAEECPTPARRPRNTVLENARLKAEGISIMRPWAEDLAEFVRRHGETWLREASEKTA